MDRAVLGGAKIKVRRLEKIIDNEKLILSGYAVLFVLSLLVYYLKLLENVELYFVSIIILMARFLSGLGFLGIIFMAITYMFKYLPKDFRKKKKGKMIAKIVIAIVIVVAVVIPSMEIFKLIASQVAISSFSMLTGILSFVISMYIIPVWKEKKIGVEEGIWQSLKQSLGKFAKRVKRGYYYYFTKDYLKAYSIDFLILKAQMDYRRTKIAGLALPLAIIGLLYNPPLALIVLVYLLRYSKNKISILDNVFFSYSLIVGAVYPLLTISDLQGLVLAWSVPYIVGGFIALIMFVPPLLDLLLD